MEPGKGFYSLSAILNERAVVFDYPEPHPVLSKEKEIPKSPGCGHPGYRLSS